MDGSRLAVCVNGEGRGGGSIEMGWAGLGCMRLSDHRAVE